MLFVCVFGWLFVFVSLLLGVLIAGVRVDSLVGLLLYRFGMFDAYWFGVLVFGMVCLIVLMRFCFVVLVCFVIWIVVALGLVLLVLSCGF